MIHYQLRCDQDHGFDGWYKDSAAFEKLSRAGMIDCPICGSSKIGRALMAPAIAKGRSAEPAPAVQPPVPAEGVPQAAAGPMPAQVMALLQRMRAEVEKNCDYVGADFAEEARRMHRGESEHRGIYGEASDGDAEALREEGIAVARLPWVPRADG
ncbi:hypothetical protein CR162_20385 [Pseudoroseomonas rhizosphaerae]|uniref:DUF1178 domain-containing protein n=1 Tax=Teichococcus rhizosphaerae TaxID=1335062 RepID=A0A2C7A918_9PROT|nr:DUF1178 family protein [Pseudoroseomonas rhizosphaerae]PHK93087.1 hypothetical protein CR162_20390 [Pseudoroseomonas rhizosphaerae]PHK93101.1 hypothetical protein CR162_20385 [Pseudoroseomonas rhizosphaerae]